MKILNGHDSAALLKTSGLLAEINRRVLHPVGLALAVEIEKGSATGIVQLLDYRADDGIEFAIEDLADIAARLRSNGLKILHPEQALPEIE